MYKLIYNSWGLSTDLQIPIEGTNQQNDVQMMYKMGELMYKWSSILGGWSTNTQGTNLQIDVQFTGDWCTNGRADLKMIYNSQRADLQIPKEPIYKLIIHRGLMYKWSTIDVWYTNDL